MQEIYRSRDMASLIAKKQFLEENDIPCRIFLEGADITDMPSHPIFGLAYHLEDAASLTVDREDIRRAWALLHNVENPVGEDGYVDHYIDGYDDGYFSTDEAYDSRENAWEIDDSTQQARAHSPKNLCTIFVKWCLGGFFFALSALLLYYAVLLINGLLFGH